MRAVAAFFLVMAVGLSSACVREREQPETETPPPPTRAVKPAPITDPDPSGRRRAKPQPTMGALEADSGPHLPKKPPRKKPAAK